jgi:beta-lactam-binding protein with PASTA domain
MNELRDAFDEMLLTEPALPDIVDDVVRSGQHSRDHRRLTVLGAVVAVAGVTVGIAVPLALWGGSRGSQTVSPGGRAIVNGDVTVPNGVAPAYPADASAALCKAGLRPLYVTAPTIHDADGNVNGYAVKSSSPPSGRHLKIGSVVDLQLSESVNGGGPWPPPKGRSVVPNVAGIDINKAVGQITGRGLKANLLPTTPTGALLVTSESPAAGSSIREGSTVTLRFGETGSQGCPTGP